MKILSLSELPKHHAVLILDEKRHEIAESFWNEISEDFTPNRFLNQTVLDIDTVRNLISWANTPFTGEKRAIISFHTITLPAQNAMLKILEEPREGVSFILLTSNKSSLIPTLISRVLEIKKHEIGSSKQEEYAEIFFKTKPTERIKLKFITELLNQEDEEGRKDREAIKNFISYLIKYGRENSLSGDKLIKLIEMESYVTDPSASGKMILEYLALLLPQIKQ